MSDAGSAADAGRVRGWVLVVGEALVDVVGGVDHPGGSAANVAVALARLGRRTRLLTAWADDERGALLERHLAADDVGLAADPHRLERTSTAVATLAPDGSAAYSFDLDWRLPPVADLGLDADPPAAVHVCSIGAVLAPGVDRVLEVLEALGESGALRTYDVNARPSITGTGPDVVARVERVAALVDVVKASDEDLAALYPGRDEAAVAAHLLGLGAARAVVVTHGRSGLAWYDDATGDSDAVRVPAPAVGVVDTIGAGDTVAAALLDALLDRPGLLDEGADPAPALEHAARAAAVTCSRPGADPPRRSELA